MACLVGLRLVELRSQGLGDPLAEGLFNETTGITARCPPKPLVVIVGLARGVDDDFDSSTHAVLPT